MADKYVPELQATTSLQDGDLVYVTGATANDYKVTCQNLRKTLRPLASSVAKTLSYTVTSGNCNGTWFSNNGAVSSVEFTLPSASDNLTVGFFVDAAKYVIVTPQLSDRIMYLTSMDGQSARTNVVGASLFIRATNNNWYVVCTSGNWTAV
jgi:hypothetical protein